VAVTGHTGFKGAWLSLWLQSLGADVTGLAPGPPTVPSLYELAEVGAHMTEHPVDVRQADQVCEALARVRPHVVLHLAAQPMVRRSLQEPAMTYAVNVMGTVNVLEAVRLAAPDARAVVVVTSDKCYEQPPDTRADGRGARHLCAPSRPFVEGDRLGGSDPYSSSKACAELVTAAYRRTYFSGREGNGQAPANLASARAGNVIGGGDWGRDRLVADIVRALERGEVLKVRNPDAVRPWQHVLNPLFGYLRLAERLARGGGQAARAWNFGPPVAEARPVSWVVSRLAELWRGAFRWEVDAHPHPAEATHLTIDSSAAERELDWSPGWTLEQGLEALVHWHEALRGGHDMRAVSLTQIERFAAAIA
jgi:CDP-glucose 4,6-dehydratase